MNSATWTSTDRPGREGLARHLVHSAVAGVEVRPPGHPPRRLGQGVASQCGQGRSRPAPKTDPTTPTPRPRQKAGPRGCALTLPAAPGACGPFPARPHLRPGAPLPLAVTSRLPRNRGRPLPYGCLRPHGHPARRAIPPRRASAQARPRPAHARPAPYACAARSSRPSQVGGRL